MLASQTREFTEAAIMAAAMLSGAAKGDFLKVDQASGRLAVRKGTIPTGFNLFIAKGKGARTFLTQRNLRRRSGEYHEESLAVLEGVSEGVEAVVLQNPIIVSYDPDTKDVYTVWKDKDCPNHVDIWWVGVDGSVWMFQIGVITHDDGGSWFLLGEFRWKGRTYNAGGKIVGMPESPKWGAFDVRRAILDHPEFKELIASADISDWTGTDADLTPQLGPIPEGHARMQWWSWCMGMQGQGFATLSDGTSATVFGPDADVTPDADGIIRLQRNDLVSYEKRVPMKGKPPKLTGVKLVERPW